MPQKNTRMTPLAGFKAALAEYQAEQAKQTRRPAAGVSLAPVSPPKPQMTPARRAELLGYTPLGREVLASQGVEGT